MKVKKVVTKISKQTFRNFEYLLTAHNVSDASNIKKYRHMTIRSAIPRLVESLVTDYDDSLKSQ